MWETQGVIHRCFWKCVSPFLQLEVQDSQLVLPLTLPSILHQIVPGALCLPSVSPSNYKVWPDLVVTSPSSDLTPRGKGCLATLLDPGS